MQLRDDDRRIGSIRPAATLGCVLSGTSVDGQSGCCGAILQRLFGWLWGSPLHIIISWNAGIVR